MSARARGAAGHAGGAAGHAGGAPARRRGRADLAIPAVVGAPHRGRMATAVRDLLAASGLGVDDVDLRGTPRRVARIWTEEFLSGYALDPVEILGDPVRGEPDPEVVVIAGLRFHSLCPHHLLPFRGVAAVAYLPRARLFGFGRVARLVDCFTRRLTLQERATCQIARALCAHGGARGAGCVLRAEQLCLALPGERHDASEVVTTSFVGALQGRADLQARLLQAVGAGPAAGPVWPQRRRTARARRR
ncbi:MAG: GTP cyclohydrolase I FolE [Deltaproteobacteria bacterium]|nr:GTP cyclohydrolase I FolE [Deltaproteobacteria bacterium]